MRNDLRLSIQTFSHTPPTTAQTWDCFSYSGMAPAESQTQPRNFLLLCVNLSLSAALYLLPVSHLFRYQRTLWCHLLSGLLSEIILHQFLPVLSDHADHLFFDTLALHTLNLGKIKSVRLAQYFLNPSTHEDLKQRV